MMNNGQEELAVSKKLSDYEKILDDIVDKIGISYVKDEDSLKTLNLTYEQLRDMDQQECCILAYKLQQYSLYLQSVHNRLNSIKKWAEESLNKIVGKYAKKYGDGYTKYEEKRAYIISENTAAEALVKVILKAGGKSNEINGISSKVSHMANILLELSKSKRHKDG